MVLNIQIAKRDLEIVLDSGYAPDSFTVDGVLVDMQTEGEEQSFLLKYDDEICNAIMDAYRENTPWWDINP